MGVEVLLPGSLKENLRQQFKDLQIGGRGGVYYLGWDEFNLTLGRQMVILS
jgi:hypothetical protein